MKKLFSIIILSAVLLSGCSKSNDNSEFSSQIILVDAETYANAALSAVEFPRMRKITEPAEIEALFGFNSADFDDFALYTELMGVNLNKVIFIKPKPEKYDITFQNLDAFFNETVQNGAYYPAQEKSAAAAKIGETSDGFLFIVFHENADIAINAALALQ